MISKLVLIKNYAGSTDLHKIVFTLKKFPQCCIIYAVIHRALCCLAFLSPLFSFQGAIEGIPSKLNNVKTSKAVLRLLDELGVALRAPQ